MPKLGIQTRPWGPDMNRERLGVVLADVAQAGYAGFEIGAQHLDLARPQILCDLAASHGLSVAGIHVGGDLTQTEWSAEQIEPLQRAAGYAAQVGAPFLPFSGRPKPGKTLDDFQRGADMLNRVGQIAADHGRRLCYHNHNWEIADDCAELAYLVDHTNPQLVSLCLDVAWVLRGGGSPAEVVRRFAHRIAYLHVKDTRGDEWLEVGQGDMDFDHLLPVLRSLDLPWWTVEQDETRRAPVESARLSREYLRQYGL